jgi:hypothetical protein
LTIPQPGQNGAGGDPALLCPAFLNVFRLDAEFFMA